MLNNKQNITGCTVIVDVLQQYGIEQIYMYAGGTIVPLLHEAVNRGIVYYCARHEQGAGYAALAHARLTGKPQVAMVTSGPGATNIVTCIADAYFDSTSTIFITGQVGTGDLKNNLSVRQRGFQEIDIVSMVKPITKAAFLVRNPRDLKKIFQEAFYISVSGRPGPVLIDLPMDVQKAVIESEMPEFVIPKANCDVSLCKDKLDTLAKWISESEKPILLAGQGVLISDSAFELRELATRFSIPVVTSLLGTGAFSCSHPLSMGFLGHTGTQYANMSVHNSDLLISLGARLDIRQTGSRVAEFVPNGKVARIDIDKAEIEHSRVHCELGIVEDIKLVLKELLLKLDKSKCKNKEKWCTQCLSWKKQYVLEQHFFKKDEQILIPQIVIEKLSDLVGDRNCIVTTGVGSHQQWVARHFDFDYPKRRLLTSGGHGAMGYDIPSAIGANLVYKDHLVLCFVGDGSFQINMQELGSIVEFNVPVKIIIMDNNRLGIVSQFQQYNWKSDPSTGNKWNPRFSEIAMAYGFAAYTLTNPKNMKNVLSKFLEETGPALLHCYISKDEDVVPMLLAGQTMDKMWPYYN